MQAATDRLTLLNTQWSQYVYLTDDPDELRANIEEIRVRKQTLLS